jgi:DNA-binding MarR family transcriptional regulator
MKGANMPTGQGARRSGKPRAVDEELGKHALAIISFLYNRVVAGAAPALRERLGLSVTEARMVFFVGANQSMSANELARYLGLDKAAISRGANRLVELGLIVSEQDRQNGARNLLSLTKAGEVACEAIGHFSFAREKHLLSVLSAKEQRQFLESLRKVLTMVDSTNELVEAGNFWP